MHEYPFEISVRIITYNQEKYIAQALDSIFQQQVDFPIEIVIGDDFSTDNTLKIIKSYRSTEKIKLKILNRVQGDQYSILRTKNGRLYNFYDTLAHCSGKYICFLDGDDWWGDPMKLKKQYHFMENNPKCFVSSHPWKVYYENTGQFDPRVNQGDRILTRMMRNTNFDILKMPRYNGTPINSADTVLMFLSKTKGHHFIINDIKPAFYRIHGEAIWSIISTEAKAEDRLRTRLYLYDWFRNSPFEKRAKESVKNALIRLYHSNSFLELNFENSFGEKWQKYAEEFKIGKLNYFHRFKRYVGRYKKKFLKKIIPNYRSTY
ncbi:MAG: glycosyltransferase family 2 protein [Cyclobacteriaceae bacterium]|nr:glycosyltransferase family 2 protein [Cyclobacteriaceae bacterium]MCH8516929.1 glycosyltransferase family 2 protein [Cyclobacteriaceae bacterium]